MYLPRAGFCENFGTTVTSSDMISTYGVYPEGPTREDNVDSVQILVDEVEAHAKET
jgi:hypothetical protein